jgi:hypothetical protein
MEIGIVSFGFSKESTYTFRRPGRSFKKRAILFVDPFMFPVLIASVNFSGPVIGE